MWTTKKTYSTSYGLNHSGELSLIHVYRAWDNTTLWAMWAQLLELRGPYLPLLDIDVCDWLVFSRLWRLVLFDNLEGGLLSHPPDALTIHIRAPLHEEHKKVVRPKAGDRTEQEINADGKVSTLWGNILVDLWHFHTAPQIKSNLKNKQKKNTHKSSGLTF